jgi:hypothetical protein
VSTRKTAEESICIGLSAATQRVYLTALSPQNRNRIWAYSLYGEHAEILLEANDLLHNVFGEVP